MNSQLLNLAGDILENYAIKPETVRLTQSGGIKTVWKIESPGAAFCLKRLRHPLEKAMFTIKAQDYLAHKGAKVPAIIPACNGELYTLSDGQVFVVYQWINGTNINLDNKGHLEKALQGLGSFHKMSAGYEPPEGYQVSSKLGRWPHHYTSMINRLKEWKEIAAQNTGEPFAEVYLKYVDQNISLAEKALALLERSYYPEWIKKTEQHKVLCHQDYGDGNALLTFDGVYVIDLDGVTFDLPVRDLRKVIHKRMSKNGKWDAALLKNMINWYCQVNNLNAEELQVLAIDLLFPHEFHNTAKNPYRKNKPVGADKLNRAARFELEKEKILAFLL